MTRPRAIAGLGRQHLRSRQALSRGGTHWRDTSMADLVEVAPEAARLPCPGRRPAERWGTTMQIASLPHPPPAAQHPRPLAAPTLAQKPTCTCVRERVHRDRQKEQGKGLKWGGAERGHRKAQTPGGSPQASAQVFPPPQPPPPQPPPPQQPLLPPTPPPYALCLLLPPIASPPLLYQRQQRQRQQQQQRLPPAAPALDILPRPLRPRQMA